MKRRMYVIFICLALSSAVLIALQPVCATLGESVISIQSDRKVLSAAQRGTAIRKGFTVQEIKSGSTTVREYVSPSGVVFGVAWNGLIRPDLTQLLGAYSNEYHEAWRRIPHNRGRSRLDVKTNRVVVQQWGHMRNLRGRAYVPSLIPSGVSIDEIK
jgi:hypothetical protein